MKRLNTSNAHAPARVVAHMGPGRPSQQGSAARAVHLTPRGRVLVLLGLVALLYAAFALGRAASSSQAAVVSAPLPSLSQTTVQPGETLWGIARRLSPDRDPRRVVDELRQLNHLPSGGLQSGQQLLLPTTPEALQASLRAP